MLSKNLKPITKNPPFVPGSVIAACLVVLLAGEGMPMNAVADSQVSAVQKRVIVQPGVELRAKPFTLGSVRLLDSPFKAAMDRNAEYLLRLESDRLLHNFRKFAGLEPKGAVYGGWESMGIAGHTLGHYLTACAYQYRVSGDKRFKERVDYIVTELAECQKKRGDGYVGGIPDGDRIWKEVAEGNIQSKGFDLNGAWVPWYTLHKLYAGLNDAYQLAGNDMAKEVAVKLGDWAIKTTEKLDEKQWQTMLACEHGGMNDALAGLYTLTGEKRFLDLAKKFHHKAVLDPLERREAPLAGLHANTQVPKVIGTALEYEITGEERYRTISETFWNAVVQDHSYCIGGNSDGEHFGPPRKLSERLSPNTAETCNTYNMLKLTRHLFSWNPTAEYADFYERALYNHILASQNPADGMMCYFVPLKPGHYKTYSTPFESFWCCVGSGIENHTRYTEGIYFHSKDSLFWNLFIPSEVEWQERGFALRQETKFPDESKSRLTVTRGEGEFNLQIRWPYWAKDGLSVTVNGKAENVTGKPGSYVSVRRKWSKGDVVEVSLPMDLHFAPMPDNPNRVALMCGPLVMAAELGEINKEEPQVPVFVADREALLKQIRAVSGKNLTFRTVKVGRPNDVTFLPFYKMHGKRYSVYFDLFTEAGWQQKKAEYEAEQARRKDLEARTVDLLAIGEMQPERDHKVTGEKTTAGEFAGRKWRHATDGGWFSFELKVDPQKPMNLVCTYWGSDTGGREFDILVDGVKIATQVLDRPQPEKFFDQTYPLPETLTRGKQTVTVRFQAHPGKMAGGLYGVRAIRRTEK